MVKFGEQGLTSTIVNKHHEDYKAKESFEIGTTKHFGHVVPPELMERGFGMVLQSKNSEAIDFIRGEYSPAEQVNVFDKEACVCVCVREMLVAVY